jgi:vacuolar-type H+-ATPase subunit E/Vma4
LSVDGYKYTLRRQQIYIGGIMGELEGLLMIIGIIGFGIWAVFGTDERSKYRSTRRYTDEGEPGSSTYGKLVAQRKLEAVAKEKLQKEKAEDAEAKEIAKKKAEEAEAKEKAEIAHNEKLKKERVERATKIAKKKTELKIDKMKLNNRWELLRQNLPFELSVKTLEGSLDDIDSAQWLDIKNAVDLCSSDKETLYFVRVKSLLDGKSYYKLGTTSGNVEDSFRRSTQVELEEVMAVHLEQQWLLFYAAYHLAREFKLTIELCDVFEINPSMLSVLGDDVTIRPNSTDKIVQFISDLENAHKKIKVGAKAFKKEMEHNYQTIFDEFYSE